MTGPVTITDADGNEYPKERETVALCRCGASTNKPFCDGTHTKVGSPPRGRSGKRAKAGGTR